MAAFDHPARYVVRHADVAEVVSFTPTYAGQAVAGETIEASGWLEVDSVGARRVVVGTSREAGGEWIRVVDVSRQSSSRAGPVSSTVTHAIPRSTAHRSHVVAYFARFFLRSPMLSTGTPPSVGTRMTRLLDVFMPSSTSRYCLVRASGVRVWLSRRCCSA